MLIVFCSVGASTWFIGANDLIGKFFNEDDPDLPIGAVIDREEYFRLRMEHLDLLRGYDTAKQESRTNSILEMEHSERVLAAKNRFENRPEAAWTPLGPAPIPVNGSTSYSGRVSAIAVHPTNPDIAYVGTAQGGLYRTLNGGATWTPLMDNALTIAIGAVTIAPSDPTTIFVGTGEAGLCGSGCFIGVGLYRITNADTNPVLSDALNKNASGADVFTGRAVSRVIVHPTDPNIVFAATTNGIAGIGSTTNGAVLPNAGIYRTTNAMSASPTFTQLSIQGTGGASRAVVDLAIEPDNANRLVAAVIGASGDGGVYLAADALAVTPTFTRTLVTSDGSSLGRTEFAVNKTGPVVTIYAAAGTASGTLYKSVDGGQTFVPTAAQTGFCSTQCFYDIAVAVDPTDPNKVYLGGSPSLVFGRSTNGAATTLVNSSTNLHVDTQAFAIAPSNPSIVYFGSDGGIWRTTNINATTVVWNSLNNSTFSATQFMGIAVHPLDANYLLGGTQDNGTEFLAPDGVTWIRSDVGDGGFAVIDQNATDTANIVAYHTYFNSTGSQIGFSRALTTVSPGDPNWSSLRGCGTAAGIIANGINCNDSVLFYAPMVGGPNAPGSIGNTLYFGTSRLYRSIDQGTTMTDVSGVLPGNVRISAVGIAPQNDDIRLVGTTGGTLFFSTAAGATSMTNVTGPLPTRYVSRVVIDPANSNVAYVSLNGFGLASGQHVWKTSNLLSGNPTWTAAGGGIPDTPVNALVIDPLDSNTIYAGADIGVFKTSDGGANWIPFSSGLPRVAVFGIAIQPSSRTLRIATHGRGIWQMSLSAAAPVSISGRITAPNGSGLRNASVQLTDSNNVSRTATTSSFGFYTFDQVPIGDTYTIRVNSRLYRFASRSVTVNAAVDNFDFVGLE